MHCTSCGAEVLDTFSHCPRCGQTIQPAKASVQLELAGTAMQLLGWILLSIVACIPLGIPLAWVVAAMYRWGCRNLKFSDGSTAVFRGTGGQVVGWTVLYMVVVVVFQVLNLQVAKTGEPASLLLLTVAYLLAISAIALQLIRWFVSHVELSGGPPLSFTGAYTGFVGWYLLIVFSFFTIIGWAWASAGMYRWFARSTHGQGVEFQFHGRGHQILWRVLVVVLASIFIIPIPWIALWFMRWIVRNISLTRSAGAAVAA
jgi:uncharacterized membrane protein YjgN (DUF898 family)